MEWVPEVGHFDGERLVLVVEEGSVQVEPRCWWCWDVDTDGCDPVLDDAAGVGGDRGQ